MHKGNKLLHALQQDTLAYNRHKLVSFLPGNLKSYGDAHICVVFYGQLRRDRYWFNKIPAPGETGCSCCEGEETTSHKREAITL